MDKFSVRLVTLLVPFEDGIRIANDGFSDGQCSMGGKMGRFFDDWFLDPLHRLRHNCTLIGYPMFGSLADGTGVKGAMAKNLADMNLMPSKLYESDDFDYSYPIYDENLQMVCSYNYTEKMDSTDIIDAYLNFHWTYYMSLICTLIFFIFAWRLCTKLGYRVSDQVRNEVENARLPSYWLMLCAILDQDQFPNISRVSFSALSACFSLFFFITIDSFMMNMMSADLVSIEEPKAFRSYQDIVDRDGVQVVFFNGMEEMDYFKDAAQGTAEHELWKKRLIIDSIDFGAVTTLMPMAVQQRAVMIVRDWLAATAGVIGTVKLGEMYPNLRVMITNDETGKRWTNAHMYQKNVDKNYKKLHGKFMLQYALSGVFEWGMKERNPATIGGSELNREILILSKLFLAEAPEPNIKHKNIIKLYYIYFTLLLIAFIALLYEKLHYAIENSVRMRPG